MEGHGESYSEERTRELMASFESTGGTGWFFGPEYLSTEKQKQLDKLPELKNSIKKQIDLSNEKPLSIALIDWTTLDSTLSLMKGKDVLDPFVSLLDMCTLIRGIIFYDYIIVLDNRNFTQEVNEIFGLNKVIRAIDPNTLRESDSRMRQILNQTFVSAVSELDAATRNHAPWINWLRENWKLILPTSGFPTHNWDAYDTEFGYTASPDRQSGFNSIFEQNLYSYETKGNYDELILDNDVRALFYEELARRLDWMVNEKGNLSVKYLGGCLRSPMLIARASLANKKLELKTKLEETLQKEWRNLNWNKRYPIQLPFWMAAVVSDSNSVDKLAEKTRNIRKGASSLRKQRPNIETELRFGNVLWENRISDLLKGETTLFSEQTNQNISDVADVARETAAILPPDIGIPVDQLSKSTRLVSNRWLGKIGLKLFRPHLYFIYNTGQNAKKYEKAIIKAIDLSKFDGRMISDKPLEFIRRFGELQWISWQSLIT